MEQKEKAKASIRVLDYGYCDVHIQFGKWMVSSVFEFSNRTVAENQIRKFCKKYSLPLEEPIKDF
jgi:hypothetical protein